MTKAEKIAKLKAAGLDDSTIETIIGGESNESEINTLKAKIAEAEGKANGILGDKKKYQQKVEELQNKLDELEGKDLNETGKMKLELERLKSKYEAEAKARADLETTYQTERRNADLGKIAQKLKFLDTVPEDTRHLIVSNELKDLSDLGNEVLVSERLKSVSNKYAGLLAADVPRGAGAKAGQQPTAGNRPTLDGLKNKALSEIAKDPKAYVREAMAAAENAQ
jgi:hypothetical protein